MIKVTNDECSDDYFKHTHADIHYESYLLG